MGLGALLILISSYQLFFKPTDSSSGLKLGTLTSTLSVVKTKNALSLDWRDASQGNDLTENQLIYTDNASSAEVSFTEGSSLEIGENSLVKLKAASKEHSMDLSKGFVRAKLEGDKPLKVQMNGEDYVVSGSNADIQINLEGKKGEIGVLTGEVKVEKDGLSENLNTQSALEITDEGLKRKVIYFKALRPVRGEVDYILNRMASVQFEWEPNESAKVIVSRKSNLENPQIAEGAGSSSLNLSTGLYYYRIENAKGSSLLNSFKLVQEVPPKLIRPLNGDEMSVLEGEEQVVSLQWQNPERLQYVLEWDDGEVHTLSTSLDRAAINITNTSSFKWRLKILSDKRPDALWSEWQDVKVVVVPIPQVPQNLVPHEVEFQTYEAPNETIDLSWESKSKVELEIKDPAGKISSFKVENSHYEYTALLAGIFSWRVKAFDSYLRTSNWSEWKTFTIVDLSNEKTEEGIQRFQLKKPDQSVTFNWQAEEGAVSVFELAKDSDFKTVVKKVEVNKDSVQVSIPEVGAYYWRSRRFLPDGTFEVGEPRRVIIEPVPAPEKPDKLPDLEVPLEDLPVKTTFLEAILNFILPSAHADELGRQVQLTLPVKEEAKAYVVRIFKDQNLTELVYEEKIMTKEFIWKNALAGVYYWQYAVIDYWDRQSLFSDPGQLTVKAETISAPEKPRLRFPVRAREVEQSELVLDWTDSKDTSSYKVEISESKDFQKVLQETSTKKSTTSFTELKLDPKLYYWRVHAYNKRGEEILSNTGRFTIKPTLEKILIIDHAPWKKEWKKRAFVAWAPSMDSYTFEDGETGKIDGTAMMGIELSGSMFKDKWTFNGEILRQTGEVYEGESYLFQRILVDAVRTLNSNPHHKITLGIAVGQTTGQSYNIGTDNAVSAESVSGPSYGPIFKNFMVINQSWEMQGRAMYLLGDIKQMEVGADLIRHHSSYLLLGGLGYSSREYEINSGKQSSIKISLGIGKEF